MCLDLVHSLATGGTLSSTCGHGLKHTHTHTQTHTHALTHARTHTQIRLIDTGVAQKQRKAKWPIGSHPDLHRLGFRTAEVPGSILAVPRISIVQYLWPGGDSGLSV